MSKRNERLWGWAELKGGVWPFPVIPVWIYRLNLFSLNKHSTAKPKNQPENPQRQYCRVKIRIRLWKQGPGKRSIINWPEILLTATTLVRHPALFEALVPFSKAFLAFKFHTAGMEIFLEKIFILISCLQNSIIIGTLDSGNSLEEVLLPAFSSWKDFVHFSSLWAPVAHLELLLGQMKLSNGIAKGRKMGCLPEKK